MSAEHCVTLALRAKPVLRLYVLRLYCNRAKVCLRPKKKPKKKNLIVSASPLVNLRSFGNVSKTGMYFLGRVSNVQLSQGVAPAIECVCSVCRSMQRMRRMQAAYAGAPALAMPAYAAYAAYAAAYGIRHDRMLTLVSGY